MHWFTNIKDDVLQLVSSRKFLASIILLTILLVFWHQIWIWFDEVLVDPLLSCPQSSTLNDVLFYVLAGIAITLGYVYFRDKRRMSKSIILFTLLLTAIYIYWRFFSNQYLFVPLTIWPLVKLSDLLFLISSIVIALIIRDRFDQPQEPIYHSNPFLMDMPLIDSSKDAFGRVKFAKEIAQKFQSKFKDDDAGALAIGINGAWGSGKTSFTNLIKNFIDQNNRIILDFNPWSSTSPSKIIEDFFELLVTEMARHDPKLSRKISEYSKTLTSIDNNAITKGVQSISEFLFDGNSINHEEINHSIGKLKKQVIIFIDDLDRLDKREIIEVLRIIRNTANFNKVVYIASYDREYVEEAIKSFNPHKYKTFLEKFFQFEFTLPKYEKAILRRNLKNLIIEKLGQEYTAEVENAIEAKTSAGISFANKIIRSQRDVVRLANSFTFEFKLAEEEVLLIDAYLLQLLKLKYQNVYENLYEYQNLFFITETNNSKSCLRLRKNSEKSLNDDFSDVFRMLEDHRTLDSPTNKSNLESKKEQEDQFFLYDYLDNVIKDIFDKDIIKELIDELLKEKVIEDSSHNMKYYKAFAYPGNFHKYFSFQLLSTDLPAKEFEIVRRGEYKNYKRQIFAWIEEGKLPEIIDRIEKINDFTTLEEFENHLKISIDVGKFRKENGGSSYGLNYWQVVRTLRYPVNKYGTFNIFESKESYQVYLRDLFSNAPAPYIFESNVVVALMSHQKDFVLSNDELTQINIKYLNKYCETNKAITGAFREIYRNCVQLTDSPKKELIVAPEAAEIFKAHFKAYLKSCELSGFILHSSPVGNFFQVHTPWIKEIFNSEQEFEDYLATTNNLSRNECYSEFLDFYEKSKDNLFNAIEYEFNKLNPNRYS